MRQLWPNHVKNTGYSLGTHRGNPTDGLVRTTTHKSSESIAYYRPVRGSGTTQPVGNVYKVVESVGSRSSGRLLAAQSGNQVNAKGIDPNLPVLAPCYNFTGIGYRTA